VLDLCPQSLLTIPSGRKLKVAGLHFHQEHITSLVDGDDVNLAVLLTNTGRRAPISTAKQGVEAGIQSALKLLKDLEFSAFACTGCLALSPVGGCAGMEVGHRASC